MKDDNRNARFLTIGIAVVLILIICGISFLAHTLHGRNSEETRNKLQSDIIEYASSTQEQHVPAKETETETEKETGKEENKETAVVVEEEPKETETSIMEEEAKAQAAKGEESQKTTAKWQKESNENLAAVEMDLPRQMAEMRTYWEAGNMEAVEDLAYLPRYRAASEKLSGTTKYYYFGDTDAQKRPNGKGLAMYTDNQYYYGEWKDGVRSGSGMWIKYYVYDQNAKAKDSIYLQHSYSGTWAYDLPNGEGAEHYDFIDENLEENVGYNRNFIGTFKNGLYDGDMYITNYYRDGNSKEWNGTAQNGVWKPMGEKDNKGQYPVIAEWKNPDNYQWMTEKENAGNGVKGLISAAK